MLRATCLVLLTCACVPALAQNGRAAMTGGATTACQEIADKATENAHAAGEARGKAAVRNKYSLPAGTTTAPALPTSSSRGGGDGDDTSTPALPRPRGPKWHSFLPGMFR